MFIFKLCTRQNFFIFKGTVEELVSQDYYDDLIKLECRNEDIKYIPRFPRNALIIILTDNKDLKYLPPLTENIVNFYVYNCNLKKLPILNDKIKKIYCKNNSISNLPENLPLSLQELSLENNKIKSIPDISKNNHLEKLNISNNYIEKILYLPDSLICFECADNKINSIQNIPKNLRILDINNNLFRELPLLHEKLSLIIFSDNIFSYDLSLILNKHSYKAYNFYITNRKRKSLQIIKDWVARITYSPYYKIGRYYINKSYDELFRVDKAC